jgi:hypothetical protein
MFADTLKRRLMFGSGQCRFEPKGFADCRHISVISASLSWIWLCQRRNIVCRIGDEQFHADKENRAIAAYEDDDPHMEGCSF